MNNDFENKMNDADVTGYAEGTSGEKVSAAEENAQTAEYAENSIDPVSGENDFEIEVKEVEEPVQPILSVSGLPEGDAFIPIQPSEFNITHKVTKKKGMRWPKLVLMALVAGCIAGVVFGITSGLFERFMLSDISISSTKPFTLNKDGESAVSGMAQTAKIADECMPSVVAITNRGVEDVMTFFGSYQQESVSSGSGIIIGKNDTELLIVTNYHVVANSKELSVVFSCVESRLEAQSENGESGLADKEDIPTAIVKGYNAYKDLAVIAVSLADIKEDVLSEIKIATIGDSSSLRPGDQVVAIGNALGYGQSVTTGIVSAVNRKITMRGADGKSVVTNSFIQTDAAINQGNSGGALLDMEGRLIGINSVKIAVSGVEGMGYAIPISDVEGIIDELILKKTRTEVEKSEQGFLGITGADVSAEAIQSYGMPAGVYVNSVMENLGAQKAGIKSGDIITSFDGHTITAMKQLQELLLRYKAGEKVKIKVKSQVNGTYKEREVEVTLSSRTEE